MNGASIKNKDVFLEGGDVDLNDLWVEAVPNFQAEHIQWYVSCYHRSH